MTARSVDDREQLWALAMLVSLMVVTVAWWALALWPVDGASPAWLARTQAICFGTQDNGMPDVTGWAGLIACPLGMLLLLLATASRPLAALAARVRSERWLKVVALLLFFAVSTASAAAASRITGAYGSDDEQILSSELGSSIRMNRKAPLLELVDQSGSSRSLTSLTGRPVIVTFAYAHCETVCPILVHTATQAQEQVRAGGRDVALMIVTLDPARDTPARLPTIARQWGLGRDAYVLSGSTSDVQATLDRWGVSRSYNAVNGDVTHMSTAYVVGRNGRLIYEVSSPTPDHLVELISGL